MNQRFGTGSEPGKQTFAFFGFRIGFVFQFFPVRHDFAHAFARQSERARKRFFAVLRKLREHRRKKFRRRLRFEKIATTRIGIELGRRQRRLFHLDLFLSEEITALQTASVDRAAATVDLTPRLPGGARR